MSSNLAKRMERLEDALKALGRADTDPLYARGSFDEPRPDTLDRLEAEGRIEHRDRERVTLIYREAIEPPQREEEARPQLAPEMAAGNIFGGEGRRQRRADGIPIELTDKWFGRRLEYPPSGVI